MIRRSIRTALACALISPSLASAADPVFIGSIRSRAELWDWFQADANNSYGFSGNIFRFGAEQRRETVDWKIEFAAPVLLGLPDDAIAPPPQGQLGLGPTYWVFNKRNQNTGMVFPKQAYLRLHSEGKNGHSLRLGRFEFIDGSERTPKNNTLAVLKNTRIKQRLLGPFGFTHVGRSFDGFHYSWSGGATNVTVIGAVSTRGVFQVDGWGWTNTGFGYLAYTRGIGSGPSEGELRLFSIYYHDWRPIGKTDNRPVPIRKADHGNVAIWTYGGHYVHALQTGVGTFDALGWGVGQTGRWGVQDQASWAIALEGGWQPKGPVVLKPWLRGGWFRSSGDDDPTDGKHKTFFQILPTPRVYARFPFYNMMNIEDRFAELVLRPHAKVLVRSDVHWLRLSETKDLWYLGGGAFNPWVFGYVGRPNLGGRGLATLYDVSVDVQMTKKLKFTGYYAFANGKSVMQAIYPNGKNAQYGYLELSYRF